MANFMSSEIVAKHVAEAARTAGQFAAASFEEYVRSNIEDPDYGPPIESPLEAIFYVWWHVVAGVDGPWSERLDLEVQKPVEAGGESYRLDFVISLHPTIGREWSRHGLSWPLIAVEVDGHGFHEKTREQVARRNQRDRNLQQAGWLVLHFSWSEMTTRPLECVGEAMGAARQAYQRIYFARPTAQQTASEE